MIKNLTAGETYTLTEVIAPKNYKIAESIQGLQLKIQELLKKL